ncbi:MAG: hypothetical protein Q7R78_01580 [bacterium]|nr:hypothetical protein [bacterium]
MKIINFIKNPGAIFLIFSLFFFVSIYSSPNVAKSAEPAHSGIYTCVGAAKAGKLVDCGNGKKCAEEIIDGQTVRLPLCNFSELIVQVNYLITFAFKIFVPIVVCIFIYAGVRMMSSKPDDRAKAREMLKKVVIGFAIMCSAFIIVKLVMEGFADSGFLFLFN